MAQAMASMTGLRGSSQGVLPGPASRRAGRARMTVRASSAEGETAAQAGRRAVLGLMASGVAGGAFAQAVLAITAKPIKVGPPPPPSGGLPGTLNADQPRDLDLPLKERFYIQPLPPVAAAARAKESAQDIINLKPLIDKKQWPYVRDDLRLKLDHAAKIKSPTEAEKSYAETKSALNDVLSKLG